ncbi:MAG: hypothetical protein JSS75_08300 [Bacteroidetes bacterium]|nr:hypothetical protein [Bacteroidota bacterium]
MKITGRTSFHLAALAMLLLGSLLSSCKENISTIGSDYVSDSVFRGSSSLADASVLRLSSFVKPTVSSEGRSYNSNHSSPYLFIGQVASEGLSAWPVLKLPFLQDSVGQLLDDTLKLHMSNAFYYGTSGSTTIEFDIYISNTVSDSMASISASDLVGAPIAHYSGIVAADSVLNLALQLDTARLFPALRTTQLSLVLVPSANMSTIRAFASNENGSASLQPTLQLLAFSTAGNYTTTRIPEYDFHVAQETQTPPTGTFELRGSVGRRERIVIDTRQLRTQLGLGPFATINSGLLTLFTDPTQHTFGSVPTDSSLPALIYRDSLTADSIAAIASYGSRSTTDANAINYQIRTLIEYAVRHSVDSVVLEVQTGYASRAFGGTAIFVEDYNVNRWICYGQDALDPTKRPRLTIAFSYLK